MKGKSHKGRKNQKGGKKKREKASKVCLVADFRNINKTLRRPGVPLEGSSQLLRRMDPNHRYWFVMDMTSGYHQIYLPEEFQDLFAIILPQGKFRYCRVPQGTTMASDIFLHITDRDIRNRKSFYKNMDDVCGGSKSLEGLERKLRIFLEVCRSRNMKHETS